MLSAQCPTSHLGDIPLRCHTALLPPKFWAGTSTSVLFLKTFLKSSLCSGWRVFNQVSPEGLPMHYHGCRLIFMWHAFCRSRGQFCVHPGPWRPVINLRLTVLRSRHFFKQNGIMCMRLKTPLSLVRQDSALFPLYRYVACPRVCTDECACLSYGTVKKHLCKWWFIRSLSAFLEISVHESNEEADCTTILKSQLKSSLSDTGRL